MNLRIISILDEQEAVAFTGKVNVLSNFNHQFLGHVLFQKGDIVGASFNGHRNLKALYHLCLQEFSLQSHQYVIEPEIVESTEGMMSLPYEALKKRLAEGIKEYQQTLKWRPPENVKILLDAEFLEDNLPVAPQEFEVMCSLTEWSTPFDIYQHCPLLDHEITIALVGLRKKSALKILQAK